MSNIFNTEFELSMRILLILNVNDRKKRTIDNLVGIDFITVYGKDFGVSNYNLHGDNNYRFSEYTTRRDMFFKTIKNLVIQNLVEVSCLKSGFFYKITEEGKYFCNALNDDYAVEYTTILYNTIKYVADLKDRELLRKINEFSIKSLKGGLVSE